MRPSSDRNPGTPQAPDPFQNYNTAYNIPQNEDGEEDEDFGQSYIFTIQSEKLQLTSGENQISNKHLVKMIQRATNPDYIENDFVFELLLTYPCFTTPIDMLHCIAQRYQVIILFMFLCFCMFLFFTIFLSFFFCVGKTCRKR